MSQRAFADPTVRPPVAPSRTRLPLMATLALAVLVPLIGGTAFVGGWAWRHFGSASAAVAFLRGEPLWIEPQSIDVGPVSLGEDRELILGVSNLTGRTIAIHGMSSFCGPNGCVSSLDPFPFDVAPRSARELTIHAQAPLTQDHPLRLDVHLYTSIGVRMISICGKVCEVNAPTGSRD